MNAESHFGQIYGTGHETLQWGRVLMNAERERAIEVQAVLQWGRVL